VQDFHHILVAFHEDKYPFVVHIMVHQRVDHTAQGVKLLRISTGKRVQEVLQGLEQMEHTLNRKG